MLSLFITGLIFFSQMPTTGGTSTTGGMTGTSGTAPGTPQSVLERPVISDEYVLMPGDECLTTIMGGTNYTYPFTVSYEGKAIIVLPIGMSYSPVLGETKKTEIVGAVHLSGLTIRQAEDSLTRVFKKYYKNVTIELTLVGMRTFNVFISGEIRYPGVVFASPVDRASEIIKRAGGVTALGSRSNIRLTRGAGDTLRVDLEKFESQTDLSVNPYVQDGDFILIPPIKGMVTVKGAIFGRGAYELRVSAMTAERERVSEGIYELKQGDRVSDLVTRAGGAVPWADLEASYIERLKEGKTEREKIPIDLYDILMNKNGEKDLPMAAGDILVVPARNNYVYVMGEVEKPGPLPYEPSLRMSDYVAWAGIKTEANVRGAKLIRGKKKFSYKKNPVVEPGDEIRVPRVLLKFWQDYIYIASVGGALLISYLTLQAN